MPGRLKLSAFSRATIFQVIATLIFLAFISANSIWFIPLLLKMEQDVSSLQLETANRARDEVSNFINTHVDELERVSANIIFSENKEPFLAYILKNEDIQQVVLANKKGKETAKIHRYHKVYPEELSQRIHEKGFGQAILAGNNYISPVFTENLEPMLNIVVPLRASESEVVGALEITLNLKSLWKKLGELKVGAKGSVYIVDSNGIIIAHKDSAVVLSGAYVLDKEITRSLVFDKREIGGLGPESRYMDINAQEVFGVGVPIANLGWGVIAEQPWEEAFVIKNRTIGLAEAALGVSVILLLLLQIVISRLIKATSELTRRYAQLESQKNELDKTTKMLVQRDLKLSETRDWLRGALIKSDKARIELDIERNRIQAVIGSLIDGLIVLNSKNKIISVNPSAEKIFEIQQKEVDGKSTEEVSQYPRLKALFDLIAAPMRQSFCQPELVFKKPKEQVFQVVIIPFKDKQGNILGVVIAAHDITREKNVEKLKTDFVSLAAHQLRTPLSAVKWILRTVLDGDIGKVSKEQFEILNKGYQSNERMISLINDLLNVARIEEGRFLYNFTDKSIEEMVEKIISNSKEQAEKNKIKVVFEKPSVLLPKISMDAEKMELAIQNIFDNSVVYNKSGGKVTISAKSDNLNIEIKIEDTGIGIPKNQHDQLFNKFFRADNAMKVSADGSGLGLFISKNIIEAHKGKLWFESEENKGTTFWITLPVA